MLIGRATKLSRLRCWLIARLAGKSIQVLANVNLHRGIWYISEGVVLLAGKITLIGNTICSETPEMESITAAFLERVQR